MQNDQWESDVKKGEDIAERLVNFAVRIVKSADVPPKTPAGRAICAQMVRSGTSPGANYENARGGGEQVGKSIVTAKKKANVR